MKDKNELVVKDMAEAMAEAMIANFEAACKEAGGINNLLAKGRQDENAELDRQNEGKPLWNVQVFGERGSDSWEISVIRKDFHHGQKSWGWFNEDKILISHNGGPCRWPIPTYVFDKLIVIAQEVADKLNNNEKIF